MPTFPSKGSGRPGRPNGRVYLVRSPNALAKQDVKRREGLKKKVESGEMTEAASDKKLDELRIAAQMQRDEARDKEVALRTKPPKPAPTFVTI